MSEKAYEIAQTLAQECCRTCTSETSRQMFVRIATLAEPIIRSAVADALSEERQAFRETTDLHLDAARAEARRETVRQCAEAICVGCRDGLELYARWEKDGTIWHKRADGVKDLEHTCSATSIRALYADDMSAKSSSTPVVLPRPIKCATCGEDINRIECCYMIRGVREDFRDSVFHHATCQSQKQVPACECCHADCDCGCLTSCPSHAAPRPAPDADAWKAKADALASSANELAHAADEYRMVCEMGPSMSGPRDRMAQTRRLMQASVAMHQILAAYEGKEREA